MTLGLSTSSTLIATVFAGHYFLRQDIIELALKEYNRLTPLGSTHFLGFDPCDNPVDWVTAYLPPQYLCL